MLINFTGALSPNEKAELMKKWYMMMKGAVPESFNESDLRTHPFIMPNGGYPTPLGSNPIHLYDIGTEGSYMNPLFFPGNNSSDTEMYFRNAIAAFNEFTNNGNGGSDETYGRGLVGPFATEIINGGVYDSSNMLQRYRLAMYIIEAYENAGAEWIDITRVLDCRIKKLETRNDLEDNYTGKFYWLIEKWDGGSYVPVGEYDNMGQFLNYRFTSVGDYKITRYPYYTTKKGFSVAMYACEYSFISDTRNVIFMDENFTNGSSNVPSMYSTGDSHKSYDVETIIDETEARWRNGNQQVSGANSDSNTPLFENDYAECYPFHITDAELDMTILDLQNGGVRSNFDTERIK
jgi:hypothetical protein